MSKRPILLVLGAFLAVPAGPALPGVAQLWLSETEIQSSLAGRTIDGRYPNGDSFTETYLNGGRIRYQDEQHSTGGRWSITEGTFCTIYDNDLTGGCFRVLKTSANCFEFYFVARNEYEAARPRDPDWAAQGWFDGESSTCVGGDNV